MIVKTTFGQSTKRSIVHFNRKLDSKNCFNIYVSKYPYKLITLWREKKEIKNTENTENNETGFFFSYQYACITRLWAKAFFFFWRATCPVFCFTMQLFYETSHNIITSCLLVYIFYVAWIQLTHQNMFMIGTLYTLIFIIIINNNKSQYFGSTSRKWK